MYLIQTRQETHESHVIALKLELIYFNDFVQKSEKVTFYTTHFF